MNGGALAQSLEDRWFGSKSERVQVAQGKSFQDPVGVVSIVTFTDHKINVARHSHSYIAWRTLYCTLHSIHSI